MKSNSNLIFLSSFIDNQYRVTVYTGNKIGAGTDADVFITLYGKHGDSGPIMLDDKKNNFEAGKFVFEKKSFFSFKFPFLCF